MNSVGGAETDSSEGKVPELASGTFAIWGDIRMARDAVLQAKVKGNVLAVQKVILTPDAEISGRLQGGDVCVEGKVEGGVEARGRVWIKKGAVVQKQCVAHSLRLEVGGDFRGELKVGGG